MIPATRVIQSVLTFLVFPRLWRLVEVVDANLADEDEL